MYDVEKCSTVLENAAGFMKTRHVYIQSCNKMVALGYVLYIGETNFVFRRKLYVRFRYFCASSCMTGTCRCSVSSARSVKKIWWEEKEE